MPDYPHSNTYIWFPLDLGVLLFPLKRRTLGVISGQRQAEGCYDSENSVEHNPQLGVRLDTAGNGNLFCFEFLVLATEPRASCMLGEGSITKLPPPHHHFLCFLNFTLG